MCVCVCVRVTFGEHSSTVCVCMRGGKINNTVNNDGKIWPYILPNCRLFYSYVVVDNLSFVMYMLFVTLFYSYVVVEILSFVM